MRLNDIPTSHMPGPGDLAIEPPDYEEAFDAMVEADAILAEATTGQGAEWFASEMDGDDLAGLVHAIALAMSTSHVDDLHHQAIGRVMTTWMRGQAVRIASKRFKEGRL